MTQLRFTGGIAIEGSRLVPAGRQILWKDGQPIWCGELGAPTEDVDYDRVTVNPADYERISSAIARASGATA